MACNIEILEVVGTPPGPVVTVRGTAEECRLVRSWPFGKFTLGYGGDGGGMEPGTTETILDCLRARRSLKYNDQPET